MPNKNIHITKRPDGNWQGIKPGAERPSFVRPTQAEAIDRGRDQAQREGSELVIHGRGGRIRDRNSYGNDPYPPKG